MSKARNRRRRSRRGQDGIAVSKQAFIAITAGLAVFIVGMAAIFVTRLGSGGTEDGTPRIQVDQPVVDHGDQPVNALVSSEYVVRNVGDGTLRISESPPVQVREGC